MQRPSGFEALPDIEQAMQDAKLAEAKFIAHYGIPNVQALPADLFDAAMKKIAEHKNNVANQKTMGKNANV